MNAKLDDLFMTTCPFCGSAYTVPDGDYNGILDIWYHYVICEDCKAQGPQKETEADAIAAWNMRNDLAARKDATDEH